MKAILILLLLPITSHAFFKGVYVQDTKTCNKLKTNYLQFKSEWIKANNNWFKANEGIKTYCGKTREV